MSFELSSPKASDEMFYERKSHGTERSVTDEDAFQNEIVSHEELFESISEAHYLPELSGPHDEALLESLVEKGCEDNQILGQALDKLAHLVHGTGEYGEEEEDMLLSGAPVADIIDRLEQSLESPTRSSMTAAQGLLHLHHIGDHQQSAVDSYIDDEVFVPDPPAQCSLPASEMEEANEVTHYDYTAEQNADKRLQSNGEPAEVMYTEQVPDMHETYDNKEFDDESQTSQALPQQTDVLPDRTDLNVNCEESEHIMQEEQDANVERPEDDDHNNLENNEASADLISEISETCVKVEAEVETEPIDNSDKPTDLSIGVIEDDEESRELSTDNVPTDKPQEKPEEFPRDLTIHRRLPTPHASPRIEIPRAPSRESDAMQSPQPSGIPAISSPEVFNAPQPKQKQPSFLESLYASTSPKMYTSEVTITKQQYEPLNLGKHRKSASPTVSSCSDEVRKPHKDYGEPHEKRSKRDPIDDLGKISNLLQTCDNLISDKLAESKQKKPEQAAPKPSESEPIPTPLQQLEDLRSNKNFNIPDPLLIPKDKLNDILMAPGIEIPALLMQRPELRLPEIFEHPSMVQDPDILVISLRQLENIVSGSDKLLSQRELISPSPRHKESRSATKSDSSTEKAIATTSTATPDPAPAPVPSSSGHPKPIPSMGALADDIDAATSAALNQMLWLPYLSQLEAMAACSQNMDFLKALNSSGYSGTNYAELSQMFNHPSRFMNQGSFPVMPGMDYDSRMQFAMWQEAMNQANTATPQRHKSASSVEAQLKEMAAKTSDFPSSYVHSGKPQSKSHSAARTSPIANNYTNSQRSMAHNPFLQSMYPGMNPNVRPNVPLPGLRIFNLNQMGSHSQRSPRTAQQKSPTSPYYPNNNYLQAVKPPDGVHHRDRGSSSSQESPRPRISVKSLQELQQTAAGARRSSSGSNAGSGPSHARRREDRDEVGSTSDPPRLPPHPHDPSSFHLWHPLFGNQKGYTSPWSWTTVTATGD